jgi:hypothetical protein
MNDCSNCGNSIEVNPLSHVCSMEGKKYVISNYPAQGENCNALELVVKKQVKIKNKAFFKRRKQPLVDDAEQKIIEAYDRNVGPKSYPSNSIELPNQEVNVKSALGWIVAAVLAGALIASWLLF